MKTKFFRTQVAESSVQVANPCATEAQKKEVTSHWYNTAIFELQLVQQALGIRAEKKKLIVLISVNNSNITPHQFL